MGILSNIFKKKQDNDSILVGYLRVQTSKVLGLDAESEAFKTRWKSAATTAHDIHFDLIINKKILQNIFNTLKSFSKNRNKEMLGECVVLLFVRHGLAQHAVEAGQIEKEEAEIDSLAKGLHDQLKIVIEGLTNN